MSQSYDNKSSSVPFENKNSNVTSTRYSSKTSKNTCVVVI